MSQRSLSSTFTCRKSLELSYFLPCGIQEESPALLSPLLLVAGGLADGIPALSSSVPQIEGEVGQLAGGEALDAIGWGLAC